MVSIAATSLLDADPLPRVEVLVTDLPPEVTQVTGYRLADGREHQVRGMVRASTTGAISRLDTEAPFGVSVTYRAEMFNAAGVSLGFTPSVTLTLPVVGTWLHNPLDPTGAVRVELQVSAGRTLSRPVEGTVYRPQGRRVGVVIGGHRSGLRDLALLVYTTTLADADKVASMLGDYTSTTVPVLCVRIGSTTRMRVPRPLFLSVLDPKETALDVMRGGQLIGHDLSGDEVAPPAPGLFVPLLTRADLNAFYATRAALNADNLTRLDVNRRYDLAGTA